MGGSSIGAAGARESVRKCPLSRPAGGADSGTFVPHALTRAADFRWKIAVLACPVLLAHPVQSVQAETLRTGRVEWGADMKALTLHRVGWLMIGLTVLPLLARSAEPPPSQAEKLEWLLAAHDVRYAVHNPRPKSNDCSHSPVERGR